MIYDGNKKIHVKEKEEMKQRRKEKTTKELRKVLKKPERSGLQSNTKWSETSDSDSLTLGSTDFSAHFSSDINEKDDSQYELLCTDGNWFERGIKEEIAMRKWKPALNQHDGRYRCSAMYRVIKAIVPPP